MIRLVVSSRTAQRVGAAVAFIGDLAPGSEVQLIGATRGALDDLVHSLAGASEGPAAIFGVHRFTLNELAARLAAPLLSAAETTTTTALGTAAAAVRATFETLRRGELCYLRPVTRSPGFARALASTLAELRLNRVGAAALARVRDPGRDLAELLREYEGVLARHALADRAEVLRLAAQALRAEHPGLPLVLLDVAVESPAEAELVGELVRGAPRALLTVAAGDDVTRSMLRMHCAIDGEEQPAVRVVSSLERLQEHLFSEQAPPPAVPDESVRFFSAPGEGRECVEIARLALAEARRGTPFDDMAVLLRAPESYGALLESALERAGIPAYFAHATTRPDPAGRALLTLLACKAEGLSARRFAEYLSLAQVPDTVAEHAPWVAPRDDLLPHASTEPAVAESEAEEPEGDTGGPVLAGALRAPWRWEELLVEAAVIGQKERWRRRLDGLAAELRLQIAALQEEEPESARLVRLNRDLEALAHLHAFAWPLIEMLDALPAAADWGQWLAALGALAPRALRRPERVLGVLAELAPMAAVGPATLEEVRDVLGERLAALEQEPPARRYGRLFVATPEQARGRSFAVVFVPGLAERLFPRKPREDPLLLDALRARLSASLVTQSERGRRERLALRLAAGAARERLYLSYPRVDLAQARPRVPSFYALDVARAVAGAIPNFEALERDAAAVAGARLAWPAPADPVVAIDPVEHDLAVLGGLLHRPSGESLRGRARYLFALNATLARSLRTRWRRWQRGPWSAPDGLVRVSERTRPIFAKHRLAARPYSPSALQKFAVCPYQFVLSAIHRLEPRREVSALERLDPLTRGRIFHEVQAEVLRRLERKTLLPVTAADLAPAQAELDETFDTIAERRRDELAPAVLRVWHDEMEAMRADLRAWLRNMAERDAGWLPIRFELGFGLPRDAAHDPRSVSPPVEIEGLALLRGSVDLVERRTDASTLRVTDHKTGINRTRAGLVVGNGEVLQPVLYAMAVEELMDDYVKTARLSFCTAAGGFSERSVTLDDTARRRGREVLEIIDRALAAGFLPPAPREGACAQCDFREVCGPYEDQRSAQKDQRPLADLLALRSLA